MSETNSVELLELESQIQLLEGVQLFSRFNSNIIHVSGPKGAGKSYLAQRYVDGWCEQQYISYLIGLSSQTLAQQRSVLLDQIASSLNLDIDFDPMQSLDQSIAECFAEQQCSLAFVIDDAHFLADELIGELNTLVMTARTYGQWQVNVVLFSLPEQLTLPVLDDVEQEIKSVELTPLSAQEVEYFVKQLVAPAKMADKPLKALIKKANTVQAWPGELLKLIAKSEQTGLPVIHKVLIVLLVLLVVFGGWSWWVNHDAKPQHDVHEVAPEVSQTESLTEETPDVSSVQVKGANANDAVLENDATILPPDVTDTTTSVGDQDMLGDKKRVVVSSTVVDALLDDEAVEQVSSELASKNEQAPKLFLSQQSLLDVPAQKYTLQLGALSSQKKAEYFVEFFDLAGKAKVYKTVRSGKEWFIVTYMDFDTIAQARSAISDLSDELQKQSPWPKSMAQVHQEIARTQ